VMSAIHSRSGVSGRKCRNARSRAPFRGGIRDGGSSDDTAAGTHQAQHGHEPFHCQRAAEPPSRIRSVVAKRENDVNHQSERSGTSRWARPALVLEMQWLKLWNCFGL
jgi:hypothetical protein